MKVSGFSFIRNAIIYDYPILESIKSVLPLCDEFVIAVGKSEDETLELIKSIADPKIKIIETVWDDSLREGGKVLALETDKAFNAISKDSDWAFYIQGDEVLHEKYHDLVRSKMKQYAENKRVDGLLFKYLHFYGSYDYVGASSNWYRNEIRIIKNDPSFYSFKDAQGFRKGDDRKLGVVPIDAYIFHYGWVRKPDAMQKKQLNFNKYWHDDQWIKENVPEISEFKYEDHLRELKPFEGTHPQVMQKRIQALNWKFDFDPSMNKRKLKDRGKAALKAIIGTDFGHGNYKILWPRPK